MSLDRLKRALDLCLARYKVQFELLKSAQAICRADPTHRRNLELGIISRLDPKRDAITKIDAFFEHAFRWIDRHAFLDLAATFESGMVARIDTLIGETRSAARHVSAATALVRFAPHVVRDRRSYESIGAILLLIGSHLSGDVQQHLARINDERNRIAHGSALDQPLSISVARAHAILSDVLREIA